MLDVDHPHWVSLIPPIVWQIHTLDPPIRGLGKTVQFLHFPLGSSVLVHLREATGTIVEVYSNRRRDCASVIPRSPLRGEFLWGAQSTGQVQFFLFVSQWIPYSSLCRGLIVI